MNWPDLAVTLGASLGATIFGVVAYWGKRMADWYWPKGHHSKRVARYGVRDDSADDTDDGDQDDGR